MGGTPPFHDAFLQAELKIPCLLFVVGGLIRTWIIKTTGLVLFKRLPSPSVCQWHPGQRETRGEAIELLLLKSRPA